MLWKVLRRVLSTCWAWDGGRGWLVVSIDASDEFIVKANNALMAAPSEMAGL